MDRVKQIHNVNNNIPNVTSYQDLLRKLVDCNLTLDGRINELHALVNQCQQTVQRLDSVKVGGKLKFFKFVNQEYEPNSTKYSYLIQC
jgi:hypothetical protein